MRALLVAAGVLVATSAWAQELEGFDEPAPSYELGGFGSDLEPKAGSTTGSVSPDVDGGAGRFDLNGSLTLSNWFAPSRNEPGANEPDWRGVTRARGLLRLDAKVALDHRWEGVIGAAGYLDGVYRLRGSVNYPPTTRDTEESEVELREAYMRGPVGDRADVALGRQIVVWGTSDTLRVVDVINPLDNRAPGMTDIEDLRLPIGMGRLDFYQGDWRVTALYIPEVRVDKSPVDGAPFDPFPSIPTPPAERPESGVDNAAYAVAAKGVFTGWDLSFHLASYTDRAGRVAFTPMPTRVYDRLTMIGVAGDVAIGPWLFKGEMARIGGLRFATLPDAEYDRLDMMVGVEYYGVAQTSVAVEIADRRMVAYDPAMGEGSAGIEQEQWVVALRLSADRMRDRLHFTGVGLLFGLDGGEGSVVRMSVGYDVMTATTVTVGGGWYQGGTSPLWSAYDDRDTLFLELKRSF